MMFFATEFAKNIQFVADVNKRTFVRTFILIIIFTITNQKRNFKY